MRKRSVVVVVGLVLGALLVASLAVAAGGKKNFRAGDLVGYEENPDISTVAIGLVQGDRSTTTPRRSSTSSATRGSRAPSCRRTSTSASGRSTAGSRVFLCGTAASPGPAGTPTCPQSGTVSRTVGVGDILAPGTQGIEAGNFAELVAAMRNGSTYANVHSTKWPGGEIRAQINDR